MKKLITLSIILIMSLGIMLTATACNNAQITPETGPVLKVYAPDGAPAMAIAQMMKSGAMGYEYNVINATNVASAFTTGDADFIIAPTNAGIQLSIRTDNYLVAAVTSWGNLYIVGDSNAYQPRSAFDTATEFLAQFSAKTIASIGSGAVPDVTFKKLLTECSVTAEVTASDAATIQANLADQSVTAAILGEPAVTATLTKVATSARLASVSELWAEIIGQDFPQAALFVKKSIAENNKAAVDEFLTKLSASITYLNASKENAKELGDYMESLETSTLKGAIVSKCYLEMGQKYVTADAAKDAILPFVQTLGVNVTAEKLAEITYKG